MTRRRRRVGGALTAAMLALLPISGTLGGSTASAVAATPPPALVLVLAGIRPIAPQPGQDVVLDGVVRNTTPGTISGVAVQAHLGGQVGSRSAFDEYADEPYGDVSALPPIGVPAPLPHPRLPAGATERFQVTLTAQELSERLPAGSWQVSELGLVASGLTPTGLLESGSLRTFLPWAPRSATGTGHPIQIAWIWPLVDRPHRSTGTAWLDDDLAPQLTGQGRLNRLLDAGNAAEHPAAPPATGRHHRHRAPAPPGVPVTWAIDPLLVQDASLMSKGYTVRTPAGHTTTGVGRAAATSWLTALHAGLDGEEVLALPYGDTDQVAAVRGDLAGEAGVATAAGRAQLRSELPTSHLVGTAWPDNGFADQRTLDAMFSAGYTSVLLSSDALPIVGGQPSETPSARAAATDDGELNTILFDSGITSTVDQGASNRALSPLELQRFLAETLMIQAEAPSAQRSLVVAPGRRWRPGPAYARAVLADSAQVPWLTPVTLSTVLASPPYTQVTRGPLVYPSSARRAELRPSYLRQVRALKSKLTGFSTVLTSGTGTISNYDAALQRLLSSAYRYDDAARDTALNAFQTSLDNQMAQVKIATRKGSYITLTSHNGTVPITVSNNLDTPVRVIVKVDENQRLAVANNGRTHVMTIPANTQVSVALSAVAKTSGVFPMQVRLLTPGLHRYGSAVPLYVRSTAYGTITLVITAAATAALLIAVAIRLTRRALTARRAARAPA